MKKLFAILMSVLMIACFMPTMAFADGETAAVAKVGETTYSTLQAAIAVATEGETTTVELLADTTEDITIPAGKKVTLNLNGKTLTNKNSDTITVQNGAELTIEGTGTVDNVTHGKAAIFNNGIAVLNGGTYDRSAETGASATGSGENSYYTIVNHGNMTIAAGVTVQTAKNNNQYGKYSSLVENGYYDYKSTNPRSGYVEKTNQAEPTLTINGGTFLGGLNTIKNDDGAKVVIHNGNFNNYAQAAVQNHSVATINGGTFTGANGTETAVAVFNCGVCSNIAEKDQHQLTITGGTFNGKIIKTTGTISITGGEFTFDPTQYVKDGYQVSQNNGKFTVSRPYSGGSYVPTDNVTNQSENTATGTPATTTADINASTTTAADGTKTTTATVDDQTADKIVDKATANKSEQIIIDATSAAGAAAAAEVGIPEKTVKEIAEKTDANLTFKTDAAKVQLDKNAVDALAAQAGTTGTVKLLVKTVKSDADIHQVELKLVTSNGAVTDFHGGNVTVTIKPSAALNAKEVICVYIDDNGVYHRVDGKKNADGTYIFTTGHFSTYAIMSVEDAEKVFAQQDAKAAEQAKEIMLQARSAKTAKGNIKVNLKVNEDAIKAIEDLGYTVKYKFYRSTIKNAKYVGKFETTAKTYTNTTGKKGTRYYYKARVMVYDAQGELVAKTALTQCKYACRIK